MVATAGAIRAGRAFVELFADNTKLIKSLNQARKSLKSFGRDVTQLGKQFAKATAVFATPFVLGAKVFAEFQEQGAFVSTMLTNANKHMGEFNAALRSMSIEFGESTATLSRGLFDILSATVPADKAIETLAVSVRAARAGMVSTRIAGDAITTMLNSYSLSADNAADISDLLFAIVKRGKTTLEELAPVIGQVASIAASANVSLEEFGAALATMTRAGVRTENAVTSLRAIVSSFLKPTETSAKAAKELGFELSSTTLATEGLLGVFQRLQRLTPEQISELFPNIRALKGVIPALKQMTGFTTDIGLMADRAGRTEEAFKKMTNTLKFSFNRMLQSGVRVFDALGEAIAEPLERIFDAIKEGGKIVTFWIKNNKDIIKWAALGVVALGAMSAMLITLGTSIVATSIILTPLTLALGAVAGVIAFVITNIKLAVLTAIALAAQFAILGAAAFVFRDTLGALAKSGSNALASLMTKFKELKDTAVASFDSIADAIAAGDLASATDILWATIKVTWVNGIGFLEQSWMGFNNFFVRTAADAAFVAMKAFLNMAFTFEHTWQRLMNFFAGANAKWVANLITVFDNLIFAFKELGVEIKAIFTLASPEKVATQIAEVRNQRREVKAKRDASVSGVDEVGRDKLEKIEEEHQKRMTRIAQDAIKFRAKMEKEASDLRLKNAKESAKIQEELEKKLATAKLKRDTAELREALAKRLAAIKAAAVNFLKRAGFIDSEAKAAPATAGLRTFMEGAGTARGTFNASALLSLQGPGGNDLVVAATQATAKNTATIAAQGRTKNKFGKPKP